MPLWICQVLLALLAPPLLLVALDTWRSRADTPLSQVVGYAVLAVTGLGLGVLISTLVPGSTKEGTLVWVLPAAVELAAVAWGAWSEGPRSIGGFSGSRVPVGARRRWASSSRCRRGVAVGTHRGVVATPMGSRGATAVS